MEIAPTEASKRLQTRLWSEVDFEDIDGRYWLTQLCLRASEGFDVSRAAERWILSGELAFIPQHALQIGPFEGALFLFGSMDESLATPALARLANDTDHPARGMGITLLILQGTPDAWRAIGKLDLETVPVAAREPLMQLRNEVPLPSPSEWEQRVTRADLLDELRAHRDGRSVEGPGLEPEDWILSAIRELEPEDLDLLRQVRRQRMTLLSDEALYDYVMYSTALQALTWSADHFE